MADSSFRINRGITLNPQASAASSPTNGDLYYDSTMGSFSFYDNGFWINLASRSDVVSAASMTSAAFTAAVVQNPLIRITGSTTGTVHGITASTDGKFVFIYNNSSAVITIANQSGTEGTAANRIVTASAANVTVSAGQSIQLVYDAGQSRWVVNSAASAITTALPMIGSVAGDSVDSALVKADAELAKLFEDRNILLTDGGIITYTGTQLQFTENLNLTLNQKISGAAPQVISLGSANVNFSATNRIWYVVIDRGAGTATHFTDQTTMPAVVAANQEVFLIAKRVDSGDGVQRVYWRNGMALNAGQSVRLGASGSGGGSANPILETLKNRFGDSPWELLTPNIIETSGATLTDPSTTSTYSLVTNTYDFTVGQTYVSKQNLDTNEFLIAPKDISSVELNVFWRTGFVDTGATYQVSRDGGNEYQTVTMERVGLTGLYRGAYVFTTEAANQTLLSYSVASATASKDLDGGSTLQALGQKIILTAADVLKQVTLFSIKTGSPSGNLYVSIVKDSAGVPSTLGTDVYAESSAYPLSSVPAGTSSFTVDIPAIPLPAGTYHIVVRTDAAYKASYSNGVTELALRNDNSGPVGDASSTFNGTTWTTDATSTFIYTLLGRALDLRVKITASTTAKLDAYGLLYSLQTTGISTGLLNTQTFQFNSTANTSSFAVTRFTVNPDLIKVFYVETGQVFRYGAFSVNGNTLTFPANTFNNGGESATVTLIADQTNGGAFDNSDRNALLLATNALGSTDASVDRSISGRGIFLRRPDGTLREITIDNSDNIVVYSV